MVSGELDFEKESYKTQILHYDRNCFVFFTAYTFDTADTIPISDVNVNTNILFGEVMSVAAADYRNSPLAGFCVHS